MVWPVHNSPFSLRSPGCLEGCKMVDRGQSKKTERPCVEYLINRFESETENFCGGSNSTASSSSLAADADSSLGCSRVYPEKKLVWLTSWDLTSLNNTSCPPYFLKFFSISDMCSMKSWIQHFYLVTLYIASLNVWLTQAALLGYLRKHDNLTLKRWNFPQKGTDGSPLIFRTYSTCIRSAPKEIPNAIFIFTLSYYTSILNFMKIWFIL